MAARKKPRPSQSNGSRENGAKPVETDEPEWQRFEALAGRLVQVPKKELDEKRKGRS